MLQQFDAFGRPLFAVRSDGTRSSSKWDAWGQLTGNAELSARGPMGEAAQTLSETSYLYTQHGRQRGVNESVAANAVRSTSNDIWWDGRTEVVRIGRTSTLIPELDEQAVRRTQRIRRDKAGRIEKHLVGEGTFEEDTAVFGVTYVTAFSGAAPQTTEYDEPRAGASYDLQVHRRPGPRAGGAA